MRVKVSQKTARFLNRMGIITQVADDEGAITIIGVMYILILTKVDVKSDEVE